MNNHAPFGMNTDGSPALYCDTEAFENEQLVDALSSVAAEDYHLLNEAVKEHAWAFADTIEEQMRLTGAEDMIFKLQQLLPKETHEVLTQMLDEVYDAQEALEDKDLYNNFVSFTDDINPQ